MFIYINLFVTVVTLGLGLWAKVGGGQLIHVCYSCFAIFLCMYENLYNSTCCI